jgi:hypothetical protein
MDEAHLNITEVRERFLQEDWDSLWLRLKFFTYKNYYWLPREVGWLELEDLIGEAIVDTLENTRRMPKDIKLVTFLCGVIRSKVSHLLTAKGREVPLEEVSARPFHQGGVLPRSVVLGDVYQQIYYEELCNKIRELVTDDDLLSAFVEQWLIDTRQKPREIAFVLNISMKQVHSAQKRLKRRLRVLQDQGEVSTPDRDAAA